jgi:hypothetical protein
MFCPHPSPLTVGEEEKGQKKASEKLAKVILEAM